MPLHGIFHIWRLFFTCWIVTIISLKNYVLWLVRATLGLVLCKEKQRKMRRFWRRLRETECYPAWCRQWAWCAFWPRISWLCWMYFSKDSSGETRIKWILCGLWVHYDCAGPKFDTWICKWRNLLSLFIIFLFKFILLHWSLCLGSHVISN